MRLCKDRSYPLANPPHTSHTSYTMGDALRLSTMVTRHTHGDIVWIDLVQPTRDEVRELMNEFALDPMVADELLSPSARNYVDTQSSYFYLVLHFPAFRHTHDLAGVAQELDFIVGQKWIITTRYDTIDPLHTFSKVFDVDSLLNKGQEPQHAGNALFAMLSGLYRAQTDELSYVGDQLDIAEERVFSGDERRMVIELSNIGRDLLNFSQALGPHREILESLEKPGAALFGYEYIRKVRAIRGEHERLHATVQAHHGSLRELRETNNSLLSAKQNEIMKKFTIMAFLMLPLTLVAALFGMNVTDMPIVGDPNDFWIILGMMISAVLVVYLYFRHKEWL